MNNDLIVTNERDLKPQWLKGGLNLGSFTIKAVEFSGEGILELVQDKTMANALADMVNGQLHIRFGSKTAKERIIALLPERKTMKNAKGEVPTADEYFEMTLDDARELAKVHLPGATFDYVEAFKAWALEDFAKRGEKKDVRPFLTDYDNIVKSVEEKWDALSETQKASVVAKLKLKVETSATAEQVLANIASTYQRPVSVTMDNLFE